MWFLRKNVYFESSYTTIVLKLSI